MRESPSPLHEADNVSVRAMALIGLGLLLIVIFATCGVAFAFNWLAADSSLVDAETTWQHPATKPGVQPNHAYDRRQIQAAEDALLSQYGWQDEEHSIARIPIDRAMDLISQRKLEVTWPVDNAPDHELSAEAQTDAEAKELK